MTIEQEALTIAKKFKGTIIDCYGFPLLRALIVEALKAKQDRIETLESALKNCLATLMICESKKQLGGENENQS